MAHSNRTEKLKRARKLEQTHAWQRILVVDDNAVNLQVAKRMLTRLGCHADTTSNVRQAVAQHLAHPYDLILMDCEMPVCSGYQATAKIRAAENAGRHTPIIAWTTYSAPDAQPKCAAAGMDDVMTKPMRQQTLREILTRWLPKIEHPMHQEDNPEKDNLENVQKTFGDDFCELAELYLTDSLKRLAALHNAAADNDAKQIAKLAHAFSGSNASIGAMRLSAMCKKLESCAKLGFPEDQPNLSMQLRSIENEYEKIRAELGAMILRNQ